MSFEQNSKLSTWRVTFQPVSTLLLFTFATNLLVAKLAYAGVKLPGFTQAHLVKEVLYGFALAMFEIGANLFQSAVGPLHGKHGWNKPGARIYRSTESQPLAVGDMKVRREALRW
jgi:hypothetical protein